VLEFIPLGAAAPQLGNPLHHRQSDQLVPDDDRGDVDDRKRDRESDRDVSGDEPQHVATSTKEPLIAGDDVQTQGIQTSATQLCNRLRPRSSKGMGGSFQRCEDSTALNQE
jgi:hypothetical protein